jgi:hypothetical protein
VRRNAFFRYGRNVLYPYDRPAETRPWANVRGIREAGSRPRYSVLDANVLGEDWPPLVPPRRDALTATMRAPLFARETIP